MTRRLAGLKALEGLRMPTTHAAIPYSGYHEISMPVPVFSDLLLSPSLILVVLTPKLVEGTVTIDTENTLMHYPLRDHFLTRVSKSLYCHTRLADTPSFHATGSIHASEWLDHEPRYRVGLEAG